MMPDIGGRALLRKIALAGERRGNGKRIGVKLTPKRGDPHCLFLILLGLSNTFW
jgi:hypothetical protein